MWSDFCDCFLEGIPQMAIHFTINGDPIPKLRARITKGGWAYTPTKTKEYEERIRWTIRGLGLHNKKFDKGTPLKLKVIFWLRKPKSVKREFPVARPDVDNYSKAVMDAMEGLLYDNDSAIVSSETIKLYADEACEARTEVWVKEVEYNGL